MEIGNKIIKLRKKDKLSQEQLADKLNVTRQTISNWELNVTKPDVIQMKKISKLFNISIDELLDNDINSMVRKKITNIEKMAKTNNKNTKVIIITLYLIIMIFLIGVIIYYCMKKDFTDDYNEVIVCTIKNNKIGNKYGLYPGNYYLYIDLEDDGTYSVVVETTRKDFEYTEDYDYVKYGKQFWDKINTETSSHMYAVDLRDTIKDRYISDGAICR